MASKVDIWNLSRTLLEQDLIIEPYANEAVFEEAVWNTVRDAVLAMHPWTCALMKRNWPGWPSPLILNTSTPILPPANLLRVTSMLPQIEGDEEPAGKELEKKFILMRRKSK